MTYIIYTYMHKVFLEKESTVLTNCHCFGKNVLENANRYLNESILLNNLK